MLVFVEPTVKCLYELDIDLGLVSVLPVSRIGNFKSSFKFT